VLDAEATPLRVEVAGTVFEVGSLDPVGRAWVADRYAAFLTDRAPDVCLNTRVADEVPDEDDAIPTIEMRGDEVRLGVGGYRIDGHLGNGCLSLVAPPLPTVLSPAAFRLLCSIILLRAGGLMLHAAAVVDDGAARVFCGPSESGKTTVASRADARPVLSDETIALRRAGRGYRACATPFFGEAGPVASQTTGDAPLAAVFFLHKSTRFAHRRLARREAVQRAFSQVFVPKRVPAMAEAVLASLDALTAAVPCFELEFAARAELWSYVDAVA
jgi:hypothetical protein